jgi:hypothetical protein
VEGGAGEDRVRKDVLMRAWRTSTCSSLIDQLDYLRVRRDSIEIGAGKSTQEAGTKPGMFSYRSRDCL